LPVKGLTSGGGGVNTTPSEVGVGVGWGVAVGGGDVAVNAGVGVAVGGGVRVGVGVASGVDFPQPTKIILSRANISAGT